jgi:hypothetical protein
MRKSHDARRDLIDTCAAVEHLLDSEAQQIAQSTAPRSIAISSPP